MSELRERVAMELRLELARQRKSGSALARDMGKTQAWISARTTGKVPVDVDDLEELAAALDVPLVQLLGFDGEGISKRRP